MSDSDSSFCVLNADFSAPDEAVSEELPQTVDVCESVSSVESEDPVNKPEDNPNQKARPGRKVWWMVPPLLHVMLLIIVAVLMGFVQLQYVELTHRVELLRREIAETEAHRCLQCNSSCSESTPQRYELNVVSGFDYYPALFYASAFVLFLLWSNRVCGWLKLLYENFGTIAGSAGAVQKPSEKEPLKPKSLTLHANNVWLEESEFRFCVDRYNVWLPFTLRNGHDFDVTYTLKGSVTGYGFRKASGAIPAGGCVEVQMRQTRRSARNRSMLTLRLVAVARRASYPALPIRRCRPQVDVVIPIVTVYEPFKRNHEPQQIIMQPQQPVVDLKRVYFEKEGFLFNNLWRPVTLYNAHDFDVAYTFHISSTCGYAVRRSNGLIQAKDFAQIEIRRDPTAQRITQLTVRFVAATKMVDDPQLHFSDGKPYIDTTVPIITEDY